ncbi:MAG TPA: DUF2905 domain-containing protein [Caulobacteraceae bacterium]|nr:DUF2905 domain-containing protein [Caulobacteraceae bacterium]
MNLQRLLIVVGAAILAAGLLWPFLARLGLGRLPGDILIRRGGVTFYAPIVTCLIASIVVTLLFWVLRR